jgi:hypothetical protein
MGLSGEMNLMWSKYEGLEVQQYNIWRGSDINNMSILDSVSNEISMYKDYYPLAGTSIYQLEAVSPNACNPDNQGKTYRSSFSYLSTEPAGSFNNFNGIHAFSTYPNPFNEYTFVTFSNPGGFPYCLKITDLSGKVYRIIDDIRTSEYFLEKGDLQPGFYFIDLIGDHIYRGKIIVK